MAGAGAGRVSSPRTRGCSQQGAGAPDGDDLFPAHAGVFPSLRRSASSRHSLPRARGGVPGELLLPLPPPCSSPRTRGCSRTACGARRPGPLFPAHAGVFPRSWLHQPIGIRSSPRTRGCSLGERVAGAAAALFPAHAGVFPPTARCCGSARTLPRARGGVPTPSLPPPVVLVSSPRTRGCSQCEEVPHRSVRLFPAHAGVFPGHPRPQLGQGPLPRARGGVPYALMESIRPGRSSPRTRGCSPGTAVLRGGQALFPAHAGVFPGRRRGDRAAAALPRARGGVPASDHKSGGSMASSPRTRGCSRPIRRGLLIAQRFPACAGVFPRLSRRPTCLLVACGSTSGAGVVWGG